MVYIIALKSTLIVNQDQQMKVLQRQSYVFKNKKVIKQKTKLLIMFLGLCFTVWSTKKCQTDFLWNVSRFTCAYKIDDHCKEKV